MPLGNLVDKLLDARSDKDATITRLTRDLRRAKDRIRDLESAADGHTVKLVGDLAHYKKEAVDNHDLARRLAEERDKATVRARVAESALQASRLPAPLDLGSRDRANALALSEANDQLRQQIEAFEADMAELRARIKELEHR